MIDLTNTEYYWHPNKKHEAVDWLVKNKGYKRYILHNMKKEQVLAIYHRIRRAE